MATYLHVDFDIATEIVTAEVYREGWEDYVNCVYLIKDQFTVGNQNVERITYDIQMEKSPYVIKMYKDNDNIGSIIFEDSKFIDGAYSVVFSHVDLLDGVCAVHQLFCDWEETYSKRGGNTDRGDFGIPVSDLALCLCQGTKIV